MGRPSKLSDEQWDELGEKLAAGSKPADLAREYGVSTASISKRMSGKHKGPAAVTAQLPVVIEPPLDVPKRGRGAITTYNDQAVDEICLRLSEGEPLRAICRSDGMPAWRTVYDWIDAHPDFAARFARAREQGFDAIAEDTLELMDEKPERCETQFGDKVDPGYVQWQKNRVEQRMKLLAKWNPKRYGEKLAVGGASDLPPVQQAVLSAVIPADPLEAAAIYAQFIKGA